MNLLNKINKESFYQQNVPMLFKDNITNNHFGIITNGNFRFKIAWYSEIEPVIKEVSLGIYCIGIDQNFSIIDLNTGNILLHLDLFYNFFGVEIEKNIILVILELEIIKINKLDFKVVDSYGLSDLFESIEFNNENAIVKCLGVDEEIKIEL